jgi:hypothetical protein
VDAYGRYEKRPVRMLLFSVVLKQIEILGVSASSASWFDGF